MVLFIPIFYFRGFNFRNFVDDKPFAPLPKVFAENEEFIKSFSRVNNNNEYIYIYIY